MLGRFRPVKYHLNEKKTKQKQTKKQIPTVIVSQFCSLGSKEEDKLINDVVIFPSVVLNGLCLANVILPVYKFIFVMIKTKLSLSKSSIVSDNIATRLHALLSLHLIRDMLSDENNMNDGRTAVVNLIQFRRKHCIYF